MAELEGGTWGNILLGIATLATGIGWAREKIIKTRVESANADAQVSVSNAQETMFNMLNTRLQSVESELKAVRDELNTERAHSRIMQVHIYKLESLMREAGLAVPVFEG